MRMRFQCRCASNAAKVSRRFFSSVWKFRRHIRNFWERFDIVKITRANGGVRISTSRIKEKI
ncbi:MAG: hypothetical protein DBX55_04690 [Verrucomicrobia bacterium]|nr:MAG: hypothetical protein DBX55_04690 [Verrucomicrobiota bacterium]